MTELSCDDFEAYFRAVHDPGGSLKPFPWQTALLRRVAAEGRWPSTLDLPTGSGKTAVLDIALFHLALEVGTGRAVAAPRRIVLVIDRRTVVDQAYRRAETIRKALCAATDGVLHAVADRLRSLSGTNGTDDALATATLRGGMPRDDAWAHRPDQPLIAVSTVDQVGSRLLFRGYGVSESMRPIHAGLLGNDALLILDEVHLSRPFLDTLEGLASHRAPTEKLPDRWQVVAMSATPGKRADYSLGDEDRRDATLLRRLTASKPATLVEVPVQGGNVQRRTAFAEACAERAAQLALPGQAIAVVVNRVATARLVYEKLAARLPKETRTFLVTGRMRPLDRMDLDERLYELVRSGRKRDSAASPVVVVATQTIEAGADFDFDALVTECASLDALRQRFGRVDRLGELPGGGTDLRGVVLVRSDAVGEDADDPVYGAALGKTWAWLRELPQIDFGVDAMARVLPSHEALVPLLPTPGRAPFLLPSHLDAWVQTMPPPRPDPDVSLWLHGVGRPSPAEVQIVWRADIDEELLAAVAAEEARQRTPASGNGDPEAEPGEENEALASLLARLEVCPPVGLEALSVPIGEARTFLSDEGGAVSDELADVDGRAPVEDEKATRKERDPSKGRRAFCWNRDDRRIVDAGRLAPGMILIVPSRYGGIVGDSFSLGDRTSSISDLGDRARYEQTGRAVLRLHPKLVDSRVLPKEADYEEDPKALALAYRTFCYDWANDASAGNPEWFKDVLGEFAGAGASFKLVRVPEVSGGPERAAIPGYTALVAKWVARGEATSTTRSARAASDRLVAKRIARGEATTEGDAGSLTGVEVTLRQHLEGVGRWADGFAHRLGLPPEIVAALELAARCHDLGKVDPRFQRMLHGGSELRAATAKEPIAKSSVLAADLAAQRQARRLSRYPRGARHELASVALLLSNEAFLRRESTRGIDVDLVLHLVASHHGHCRPFAPVAPDREPVPLAISVGEVALTARSDHGLDRADSGITERFWALVQRYGWYGLAWLEALLRLSDHRRSQEEQGEPQNQKTQRGGA